MKKILFAVVIFLLSINGAVASTGDIQPFPWNKAYFYNFYSIFPLDSGETWVVGSKGIICFKDKGASEWIIQESGVARNLYGVCFADSQRGWICGQNGLILHTADGGAHWTQQESGTSEHLFSVSFADSKSGWIVGAYGKILHTADGGKSWQDQGEGADEIHNGVCFVDAQKGWVVGEFGVILHTEDGGVTWVGQKNPLEGQTLFSVYFQNEYIGWATGMDGTILHTKNGGENWDQVKSQIKENILSVYAHGQNLWAVGLKGTFTMRRVGLWQDATANIPTRAWLKQCVFVDEKNGWIVGSVGTVLRTFDGGNTWISAGKTESENQ